MTEAVPLWERDRRWPLMRPFVYYLVEDFVEPRRVGGKRVVDFSAGLCDLTRYLADQGPAQLTATVPDRELPRPADLPASVEWRTGVLASQIAAAFEPGSVDLFCARMVFQFPRWEDEGVDVDVMLEQIRRVLAPGGRLVIATHAFFPLQVYPSLETERDSEALLDQLVAMASGAPDDAHEIFRTEAQRISGLTEMVRYLGLPPREGLGGETGFGLKVPMLVDSFIRAGFTLEVVEEVEPFTYPLGVWEQFETAPDMVRELGEAILAIKQRHLTSPAAAHKYQRPSVVAQMLREVRWHVPVVWVPIVRIVVSRAG